MQPTQPDCRQCQRSPHCRTGPVCCSRFSIKPDNQEMRAQERDAGRSRLFIFCFCFSKSSQHPAYVWLRSSLLIRYHTASASTTLIIFFTVTCPAFMCHHLQLLKHTHACTKNCTATCGGPAVTQISTTIPTSECNIWGRFPAAALYSTLHAHCGGIWLIQHLMSCCYS